jgi:hypothetical protein
MRTVCGGLVLDALVQGREGRRAAQKLAAEKLLRKLIRTQSRTPRVMVTDSPGKERAPADAVPQEDQEASVQIRPIPEAPRLYPRSRRKTAPGNESVTARGLSRFTTHSAQVADFYSTVAGNCAAIDMARP